MLYFIVSLLYFVNLNFRVTHGPADKRVEEVVDDGGGQVEDEARLPLHL